MNINTWTIDAIRQALQSKNVSPVEVSESCIRHIQKTEPHIHACLSESSSQQVVDQITRMQKGADGLVLSGVPIVLKDNICTKELPTTAAAHVLEDYHPVYNATVWQRLQDAGAILIAKTNLDAWAHGSSTESSDFGYTRNPWDTTRLPGGSSGGTAASVAACQAPAGIGSETAGSIRMPASWCGVVGLKPTYGRVSRYGMIAMGSSLDCPGPMTRSVADAALILSVIAGRDPRDATTADIPVDDYVGRLKESIRGKKLGYSDEYMRLVDPKVASVVEEAYKVYDRLGATLVPVSLFDPRYAVAVYTIIQRAEVSSNLARYDGIRYGHGRDKFGREAKRRIMLGTYVLSHGHSDDYYEKAEKVRTLIMKDFTRVFESVDAVIAPTLPQCALPIGATQTDPMFGERADMLQEPSSIAGLPGISIPCGFVDDLPVGMQIIGSQFSEATILSIASAYEEHTSWHMRHAPIHSL